MQTVVCFKFLCRRHRLCRAAPGVNNSLIFDVVSFLIRITRVSRQKQRSFQSFFDYMPKLCAQGRKQTCFPSEVKIYKIASEHRPIACVSRFQAHPNKKWKHFFFTTISSLQARCFFIVRVSRAMLFTIAASLAQRQAKFNL